MWSRINDYIYLEEMGVNPLNHAHPGTQRETKISLTVVPKAAMSIFMKHAFYSPHPYSPVTPFTSQPFTLSNLKIIYFSRV